MGEWTDINRQAWDACVDTHVASRFYDVPGFLSGTCALRSIETGLLGDVARRRLLHLQCHFGLDTLSWARRGALVTGVDFSPAAIRQAKALAEKANLDAQFDCSDVNAYADAGSEAFDIVFTSYGALHWLHDLSAWAATIDAHLAPGGTFLLVEFHPAFELLTGYGYFPQTEPDIEQSGSYTENWDPAQQHTYVTWPHSLSEVLGALRDIGLSIELFREYDYSPYDCFPELSQRAEQEWVLKNSSGHCCPLTYAIRCRKPE